MSVLTPTTPRKAVRRFVLQAAAEREAERQAMEAAGRFDLPKRPIRCRDDLSFTVRDEHGGLRNWAPEEPKFHDNGRKLGRIYFSEVEILARVNREAAIQALQFAAGEMSGRSYGTEDGFLAAMAEAAVRGILADSEGGER